MGRGAEGLREFTVFLYLYRVLGSSESRARSTYMFTEGRVQLLTCEM